MMVMSRAGSDSGTSATPRRSLSALAINSSAALIRASQLDAALQPSSSRITSGARCAGEAGLRIPDRPGGGQDHQRGGQQAQRGQPPRRPRRGFFLGRDVEQQPRRRELDAPRPRRHHPQQPPQHRQADQAQQQQRFGEGERQAGDHALRPALTVAVRALPLLTIMPPCRNSSSSAAERLVVWVENSQSSLLVSARISSRCSATPRDVVAGPVFGAAGGDDAAAFRLDEFDAAGIGEAFLGRIDDLHQRAVRAGGRQSAPACSRISAIGDQKSDSTTISASADGTKDGGRLGARGVVVQHRLRHLVDHAAARGRVHQAGNADAFAAGDQQFGEREGRRSARAPACCRAACLEANAIDGERSGHSQTVCAASHSCSRT